MDFLIFLIVLAGLLAVAGVLLGVRRHRARDHSDRIDPRDQPGRAHTDGQAAAAVGLSVRGSSHMGPF